MHTTQFKHSRTNVTRVSQPVARWFSRFMRCKLRRRRCRRCCCFYCSNRYGFFVFQITHCKHTERTSQQQQRALRAHISTSHCHSRNLASCQPASEQETAAMHLSVYLDVYVRTTVPGATHTQRQPRTTSLWWHVRRLYLRYVHATVIRKIQMHACKGILEIIEWIRQDHS